ncbi:MAG: DUF3244 domain-containing protein [Bacteroidaceae bacterium]|nr:DUF3244 domain-containing protein [Bacteroidaceae bacterium]
MRKILVLFAACSCALSSFSFVVNEPENQPKEEERNIILSNNEIADSGVLSVPVTATVNNSLLNVKFNGTVSLATVSVSNTLTGATINSQSLPAVSGTICKLPVSGLSTGVYTVSVTNEESGESVSGEFDVEE